VVFLGVLNSYQGIDLLLEAVALLKKQGGNIHFLVMGYPDELYRIKASEMGLADLITFTGRIDYKEAAFLLSSGDLAVSPKLSLSEANGKLFNYMACGLPTLVFDTPVNREIMGDTGVYADYGNVTDLARCIVELLGDQKRLSALSSAVRVKAINEHSWVTRASRIKSIYLNLLLKIDNKKQK
jgi:glycosyltransferase involved in cell wall biosynthesis